MTPETPIGSVGSQNRGYSLLLLKEGKGEKKGLVGVVENSSESATLPTLAPCHRGPLDRGLRCATLVCVSRNWGGGSTTAWRALRLDILARDGFECQIRIPGEWTTRKGEVRKCLGTATQVHHTLGRGVTGDDSRYLIASCAPCNLAIGDPAKRSEPEPLPWDEW